MTSSISKSCMKTIWCTLVAILFLSFTGINKAQAFQKKSADTVSTSDVQFTDIKTAADSTAEKSKAAMSDAAKATQEAVKTADKASKEQSSSPEKRQTLWEIFIAGFLGGFAAFLMPCIYPLLPLTVSFFTKKGGSRTNAIFQSLLYGLSIIVIYVGLGLLITLLFGPSALNGLATNGIFNIFFFLLLVVFAISFFGVFEITLPGSLSNKLDSNSERGGVIGIFFFAATLV